MARYNVRYNTTEGIRYYLTEWADYHTACTFFFSFKERYLNLDGTPRPYPNGKGYYDISDVTLVKRGKGQFNE